MLLMNKEDFLKSPMTTYVYVKGKPMCKVIPSGKSMDLMKTHLPYDGFIEVSYEYELMKSLNMEQRRAICQAQLSKSGFCVDIEECDIEKFYNL